MLTGVQRCVLRVLRAARSWRGAAVAAGHELQEAARPRDCCHRSSQCLHQRQRRSSILRRLDGG